MTGTHDPLHARVAALAAHALGRRAASIEEVPAGLGARRFLRVRFAEGAPATVIARVESSAPRPPGTTPGAPPPEPPLEPIRALLEASGLPVPARLGADEADGIELLEDVGDRSLEAVAASAAPELRRALYARAVELVARLQAVAAPSRQAGVPPVAAFSRRLDAALIETKARKWLDWTIPFALGRPANEAERTATARAFAVTARACADAPARLAHRDYKAANLHVCDDPGAPAGLRLVMIDLQGAFLAPPEYDLVCLLRDSHVALPEDEVRALFEHGRTLLPDAPTEVDFARRADLLTMVRVAKDVSHYVDAAATRGDTRYLRFVATGLRNLRAAARRAAERDADVRAFADSLAVLDDDFALRPRGGAPGDPACAR